MPNDPDQPLDSRTGTVREVCVPKLPLRFCLIDQVIRSGRTGVPTNAEGSVEHGVRLLFDFLDSVHEIRGAQKVSVRDSRVVRSSVPTRFPRCTTASWDSNCRRPNTRPRGPGAAKRHLMPHNWRRTGNRHYVVVQSCQTRLERQEQKWQIHCPLTLRSSPRPC